LGNVFKKLIKQILAKAYKVYNVNGSESLKKVISKRMQ